MSVLNSYLKSKISSGVSVDAGMVAYLANLELVSRVDKSIAASIVNELEAQRTHLKMIASENYCSLSVQGALGNLLTDKYAEGFPHHRYYAGCENIDSIEAAACDEAKKLFGAEHAYVQPHSGADANMVAFWSILCWKIQEPFMEAKAVKDINKMADADWKELRQQLGNQRMLGLNIYSGGHLTHGYRPNVSARMFEAYTYDVDAKTQLLDYAAIRKQAPTVVENMLAVRRGEAPTARYDGYASCPLVTGYGKLILAEFDYDGKPVESFPFDQSQERYSMWAMKVYGLPEMYWNGMLRGRM